MSIKIHSYPDVVVSVRSPSEKVIIHEDDNSSVYTPKRGSVSVIKVYDVGKPGPRGPVGDITGQLLTPFYQVSGTVWETSHSISFKSTISSSLTPYATDTFSLGNSQYAWRGLTIGSNGISFASPSGNTLSTINGIESGFVVGGFTVTTSSFSILSDSKYTVHAYSSGSEATLQLSGSLILRHTTSNPLTVYSASIVTAKINQDGLLVLHDFDNLPQPELGAMGFSGSNLYIGGFY